MGADVTNEEIIMSWNKCIKGCQGVKVSRLQIIVSVEPVYQGFEQKK
jgi:hypothetical protein